MVVAGIEHLELSPPHDDCPRICAKTGERRKLFCETCPVKQKNTRFREETFAEIQTIDGHERFEFDQIVREFQRISSLNALIGGTGFSPHWTNRDCQLIEVLRSELQRPERLRNWELAQKVKAEQRKGQHRL